MLGEMTPATRYTTQQKGKEGVLKGNLFKCGIAVCLCLNDVYNSRLSPERDGLWRKSPISS